MLIFLLENELACWYRQLDSRILNFWTHLTLRCHQARLEKRCWKIFPNYFDDCPSLMMFNDWEISCDFPIVSHVWFPKSICFDRGNECVAGQAATGSILHRDWRVTSSNPQRKWHMGVSINGESPIAGWFISWNILLKWMIHGYRVPPFSGHLQMTKLDLWCGLLVPKLPDLPGRRPNSKPFEKRMWVRLCNMGFQAIRSSHKQQSMGWIILPSGKRLHNYGKIHHAING